MKRAFVSLLLGSLLVAGGSLRAADAVTLAAQQESLETQKRLTATIEELQMSQADLQKRVGALNAELSRLREEMSRNNSDAANKESIRKLHEQITKLDDTRIADNKRFQEALEKLAETFKKYNNSKPVRPAAETGTPGGPGRGGGPAPNANEEGFEYIVVSGDRPDKIAAKYQAEKINVTAAAIIKANPSVDWTKLQVGQKLFIPKPK